MIGLGALVDAWLVFESHQAFPAAARRTEGTVVEPDLERSWSGSGPGSSYAYYPIVTFRTAAGEEIRFRSRTGSNPPAYHRGESVGVLTTRRPPRTPRSTASSRFGVGS